MSGLIIRGHKAVLNDRRTANKKLITMEELKNECWRNWSNGLPGGNGTGLSYYLKYAEDSTEDDPIVIAKGVDENGDEFEKTIHINKINPKCATVVEMRALEAHTGVKKLGGFTSLPLETGAMGLNDRMDFMDMFQKQIRDMKLLSRKRTAAYYQYSMQAYWDFMNKMMEKR